MSTTTPRPLPVVVADDRPPLAGDVLPLDGDDHPELRTSNTVKGFNYNRLRGVWFIALTVIGLPLFPFWPIFIAWEARDWSIAKRYPATLAYCVRTLLTHLRHGSYVRLWKYNIRYGPDEIREMIAKRRGACTRCAKCCKQYECIFLGQDAETKDYYCKVYQTHYWYYGTCGRYPIDQQDIDDHACPGFYFDEGPA